MYSSSYFEEKSFLRYMFLKEDSFIIPPRLQTGNSSIIMILLRVPNLKQFQNYDIATGSKLETVLEL